MWSLIFLIFGLSTFAFANVKPNNDDRIVGGYLTTIDKQPYAVQLQLDSLFICGGSILSPKWILTAAHCIFKNGNSPERFQVRAGATFLNGNEGVIRQVKKIFRRPDYNSVTLNNDVAMLLLAQPLPLNGKTIKSIPLCSKPVPAGAQVKVSGWGLTSDGGAISNQLRSVIVSTIPLEKCQVTYKRNDQKVTGMMLCAAKQGKDACSGDSGGPFVYNNQVCGIVSWGAGCGRADAPGVYTNVMQTKAFINGVMKNNK